jgi:group I intron endonuclease
MGYVYQVTNLLNNKKYIGSSNKEPKENWSYYGSGKNIKLAIEKYGKENFKKEILKETKKDARLVEKKYLKKVDAQNNPEYYNMTNDAIGSSFHSEEGKKSKSEKLTGRKLSKEIREKISKNKTGIRFEGGYNMKITTKPGVSKAHRGRISPNKGKGKKIDLFTIEGKYLSTYNNTIELSNFLNINPETIRQCLIGKQKTMCNKQYYVKYT